MAPNYKYNISKNRIPLSCSCSFSTNTPGELNVFGHNGDTFCMNGTQVCVFEQTNQVCFSSLLDISDEMISVNILNENNDLSRSFNNQTAFILSYGITIIAQISPKKSTIINAKQSLISGNLRIYVSGNDTVAITKIMLLGFEKKSKTEFFEFFRETMDGYRKFKFVETTLIVSAKFSALPVVAKLLFIYKRNN